ncbi:hypothetical protein RUM43_008134 [Polyplax serrata]|uniref:Uncharacterized protein n=1 Tax=Polyplax serrata TaxID=468196 RepID=A0AAN8S8W5_POLSC
MSGDSERPEKKAQRNNIKKEEEKKGKRQKPKLWLFAGKKWEAAKGKFHKKGAAGKSRCPSCSRPTTTVSSPRRRVLENEKNRKVGRQTSDSSHEKTQSWKFFPLPDFHSFPDSRELLTPVLKAFFSFNPEGQSSTTQTTKTLQECTTILKKVSVSHATFEPQVSPAT